MMKVIFKMLFFVGVVSLILTSCLGDNETTYVANSEFVYIGRLASGEKYAQTTVGTVRSSNLDNNNNLVPGDCAFIRMKVSSEDKDGDIYYASMFEITSDPNDTSYVARTFPLNDQIVPITALPFDTAKIGENNIPIIYGNNHLGQSMSLWNAAGFWGDRLYFPYSYKIKTGEADPKLIVSYDPNMQYNEYGGDLPNGQRVIDFKLERQGLPSTSTNERTVTKRVIINTTNLRELFRDLAANDPATGGKVVLLRFRFFQENPVASDYNRRPIVLKVLDTQTIRYIY